MQAVQSTKGPMVITGLVLDTTRIIHIYYSLIVLKYTPCTSVENILGSQYVALGLISADTADGEAIPLISVGGRCNF